MGTPSRRFESKLAWNELVVIANSSGQPNYDFDLYPTVPICRVPNHKFRLETYSNAKNFAWSIRYGCWVRDGGNRSKLD